MSVVQNLLQQASDYLKDESQWIPYIFGEIERRTTVPREFLACAFATLFSAYLIIGHFAQLVCNFVAFAPPAYESMVAIETPEKFDDTQWLTYWTVFAVFTLFDFAAETIWSYFPLHWLAKCVFLIYLYHPSILGAKYMYLNYVRSFLQMFSVIESQYADAAIQPQIGQETVEADAQAQFTQGPTDAEPDFQQ